MSTNLFAPERLDATIVRAASFGPVAITIRDSAGVIVDLSSLDVTAQGGVYDAPGGTLIADLVVSDARAAEGVLELSLASGTTSGLTATTDADSRLWWDLFVTVDGVVIPVFRGRVSVIASPTFEG